MKRRRKPLPDTRPRWDDPDLPVFGASGRAIDYRKQEQVAKMRLAGAHVPEYKDDETYNLRRKG